MFWTEEKLSGRIRELEPLRYRDAFPINKFRVKEDAAGNNGEYPAEDGVWSVMQPGETWSGRDAYLWLAADPVIPSSWRNRKIVGRFDFGMTGEGNNSGFESLLFLNGQPYQGVDSNHREVFLAGALAGEAVSLRFRLWSGLNGYGKAEPITHRLQHASLAWLDERTDDLYYTSRAVLDTVLVLAERDPQRHELLAAIDRAFLLIDWSYPGSEAFYNSVYEAGSKLHLQLTELPKLSSYTVTCIGHTHIDVAWLWRLKHTREKAARSFSTVLRLMEQYPDYQFMQTQPQLYEYIKTDYPEIYEAIKKRAQDGKWEPSGAMWLEADCNIPSGESLVRQLMNGMQFLRREFDTECRYLWLPDVFGYSWALPQILLKSGITAFMTTKISWNQYNRMPHDTFKWRGIDGSEILTHFITTPDPGAQEGRFYYTYNGAVTAKSVTGIWDAYQDKAINRNLLLAYGYGDGGGGVNRDMLELRRRLAQMPGLPNVISGRADDYFEELQETVSGSDRYVHTWDGELYLELHRGTYTSQAFVKRANRKLELLYRESEWLCVLNAVLSADWSLYPDHELLKGWKIILRNQFHDIIPGSSINEVYEDCRLEYDEAADIGSRIWHSAAATLTGQSIGQSEQDDSMISYTVFNGAPWRRRDMVKIEKTPDQGLHGYWHLPDGTPLISQYAEGLWHIELDDMPSMGFQSITYSEKVEPLHLPQPDMPFQWSGKTLTTPYYIFMWNDNGQLDRLYDKQASREVLASGHTGNVLQVFEDKPKSRHEAWDIDIYYSEKMRTVSDLSEMTLMESGPVRAVVRFVWHYGNSVITQLMVVYAKHRRIDYETTVDWHEQRQLLKAAFPVNVRATEATYDIQFGNVKRPTHWNTSWDYARFESVGHQWADLSERGFGVSLLNDCKYGYDIKDNVMRLSLIKSAMVPDDKADQGQHIFTYSLLPHLGDWFEGETVTEAWALNNPLSSKAGQSVCDSFSFLSSSSKHVMVDAVKKTEDGGGVVVRVHEFGGAGGPVTINAGKPIASWTECNLMERPIADPTEADALVFDISPYEIKTFIIRFA